MSGEIGSDQSLTQRDRPVGPVKSAVPNPTRRRLTRAGLAASTVMTLANRPAMGQIFCSLSSAASQNGSQAGITELADCSAGQGASYWSNNPSAWSSTGYSPGETAPAQSFSQFSTTADAGAGTSQFDQYNAWRDPGVLSGPGTQATPFHWNGSQGLFTGSAYGNMSLREVMASDPNGVGGIGGAALLNASSIPNYPLTPVEVKEMVDSVLNGGPYWKNGIRFNKYEVLDFLRQLQM